MITFCFHGTNRKNAHSILREGFNPGTYFAAHLEDALAFGGPFVFEVKFKDPPIDGDDGWQFWIRQRIGVRQIRSLTQYSTKHLHGKDLAKIFSGYRKEKASIRARAA